MVSIEKNWSLDHSTQQKQVPSRERKEYRELKRNGIAVDTVLPHSLSFSVQPEVAVGGVPDPHPLEQRKGPTSHQPVFVECLP
jgi:hypothetical protein